MQVCHKRGAIGGMAAFIPSRKDAEVNARALAKVREDKEREAALGSTERGAHPDLVPLPRFRAVLGNRPQKDRRRRPHTAVSSSCVRGRRVRRVHANSRWRAIEAARGSGAVAITT